MAVQKFGTFLLETLDVDFAQLLEGVAAAGSNYGRVHNLDDLRQPLQTTLRTVAESMERDDPDHLAHYGKQIGLRRARDGFTLQEMMAGTYALRDHIWRRLQVYMDAYGLLHPDDVRHLELFIYTYYFHYSSSVEDVLKETRTEVAIQTEQLEVQQTVIRDLGAPIMPVHDGVLVLPLVGAMDSRRATQMMERLLEAITDYQADMVIIDITGVPTVDTSVANYLLQTARAANLVGAHIILVGIGTTIAQTMVQLDVDLSSITTLANLQEGIEYAYKQLGYSL